MSLDKKKVIVDIIKEYLVKWIELENVPHYFIDKCTSDMDDKSVVYALGSSLYFSLTNEEYIGDLTHINLFQPRVYQFLQRTLFVDSQRRESNPKRLLEILEQDERDSIEKLEKIDDDYTLECFSSVGLTRLRNQDYLGCYRFENAMLLIVADGVGGANGGEIASKLTTDFVIESLKMCDLSKVDISETLRNIVFNANQEVLNYATTHHMGQMGTTLSIALVMDKKTLYIAHVGDSRIYEFNNFKKPRPLTEDHSEVEILYRTGVIKKEDKKNYKKNILRYAIGLESLKKEDIFVQYSYLSGEINLFLCSDGVWENNNINESTFSKKFDVLKKDIFNSIPTDNVTFIRYHSVGKVEDGVEFIETPFEEEFIKEEPLSPQKKFKKIAKEKCENRVKKTLPIEKINKILITITSLLLLLLVSYFLIHNLQSTPLNEESNTTIVNLVERNTSNKDINITTLDSKRLEKKMLKEKIEKTEFKLKQLKLQYQRLISSVKKSFSIYNI